jgi:hypothetical protein
VCQLLLGDLRNEKVIQGMRPMQYDVSNTRPVLMDVVYGASSRKKKTLIGQLMVLLDLVGLPDVASIWCRSVI